MEIIITAFIIQCRRLKKIYYTIDSISVEETRKNNCCISTPGGGEGWRQTNLLFWGVHLEKQLFAEFVNRRDQIKGLLRFMLILRLKTREIFHQICFYVCHEKDNYFFHWNLQSAWSQPSITAVQFMSKWIWILKYLKNKMRDKFEWT